MPERARGALGLAILWIACRAASGFDGLYGQDAHEYLRYATALRNWLLVGVDPGYSPWPPAFPMSAALLSLTGISVAMSTQMVSFLSWLAAYWFGALALERLHPGRSAAGYWAGPFALSPFLMRIALSSMSDMLAIAWECACLAFGLRWLDERRALDMALGAFCLACGAATRFSVALVLGLVALWFLGEILRARKGRALLAGVLGGLVPAVLAIRASSLQQLALSNAEEWSAGNMVARSFSTLSGGSQAWALPNLAASFVPLIHPGFCFLGVLLLAGVHRDDFKAPRIRVLALSWLVFALFLSGLALQNDRHRLAAFPLAMMVLFPSFERWRMWAGARLGSPSRLRIAAGVLIAIQLGLLWGATRALFSAQRQEMRIAQHLQQEPPVTLYTFSFTLGLQNRGVPQRLVELWNTSPRDARTGDLVLFAPDRLSGQWNGHPLMANFASLRPRLGRPIQDFGGGWFLYRVEAGAGGREP